MTDTELLQQSQETLKRLRSLLQAIDYEENLKRVLQCLYGKSLGPCKPTDSYKCRSGVLRREK